MSKAKLNLVLIEWVDSIGSSGWKHDFEQSDMRCVSAGHLIEKTKDRIIIAMNKSLHADGYGDYMEIPLCAVTKITKLKSKMI